MTRRTKRSYTTEQIEMGLLELAKWHGNCPQAARCLKDMGQPIPQRTLRDWKVNHADRYQEIQATILPQLRASLAVQQERVAAEAAEAALKVIRRQAKEIEEIPVRDLSGAARNLEVTSATAVDKSSVLRGLPSEIRENPGAGEVFKRLQQRYPQAFVDSTAEEIHDAELVEDTEADPPSR